MYQVKSPILFLIFNRPDTTQRVFDEIRKVRPKRLYIGADGARNHIPGEDILCEQSKKIIQVDWDCEVFTLYRDENLGCKFAVSEAIKWFFSNEDEGIVLEDDCLPNNFFFNFCDLLLEKYRNDNRIVHISGTKINIDREFGNASYYFSKYTNVWGWASWKRVWSQYDENLTLLQDFINGNEITNIYEDVKVTESLITLFRKTRDNIIDTWDYQYAFLNFWNNGLCVCPNFNMISNIGFNENATHTTDPNHKLSKLPFGTIIDISHPKFFVPNIEADYYLLRYIPQSTSQRIKRNILKTLSGIQNKIFLQKNVNSN